MGHSERDCGLFHANSSKEIDRAYGVWMRKPGNNVKIQNLGAKWLSNGGDGEFPITIWEFINHRTKQGQGATARFIKENGVMCKISGDGGGINII